MTADMSGTHGLLLQLAAPLQSWGERSRFVHKRDTAATPTRSGLIGLISSALGRPRDEPCEDLAALNFTVRVDRPGTQVRDLQTVGGGLPRHLTVATADGKRRPGETGTLVSHRYYLQDAVFTVAVWATDKTLMDKCAEALHRPFWPPYLGRRSCPPSGPLVLLGPVRDPVQHLLELPLARTAPASRGQQNSVPVGFTADEPLSGLLASAAGSGAEQIDGEAQDDPISFAPLDRRYRTRPVYRTTVHLPVALCGGYGADYLTALHRYVEDVNHTEAS